MAIYRIFQKVPMEPEHLAALVRAYEDTLRSLHMSDRSDPIAERIAKSIIELAQSGEKNPYRLRKRTLAALGFPPPAGRRSQQGGAGHRDDGRPAKETACHR